MTASPDFFNDPDMARKLMTDVPRLAYHIGLCPPENMTYEDWLADLRETLLRRALSPKSQWQPGRARGAKSTWAGWACMVMRSRSQNLYRNSRTCKVRLIHSLPDGDPSLVNYAGGSILK
jgi:hypothetical protein